MPTRDELLGHVLHGDAFGPEEIAKWYRDEENAYAELYATDPEYQYEPVNRIHGFHHLPEGRFAVAVGLGSAFGDELRPIGDRIDRLVIVESSDIYRDSPALDVTTEWKKSAATGDLDLETGVADLVTCFGVLHHIPNVSHVLTEMGRVLKPGGYALVREPIVTLGNWEEPRPGLTPRERGIPTTLFLDAVTQAGFAVERKTWCFFGPIGFLWLFAWNYRYHATNALERLRPTSFFLVLRKK